MYPTSFSQWIEVTKELPILSQSLLWKLYKYKDVHCLVFFENDSDLSIPTKIFLGYVGRIPNYDEEQRKSKCKMRTQILEGSPDKNLFICHFEYGSALLFPNSNLDYFYLEGTSRTKEEHSLLVEKIHLKNKISLIE